jgi:hypothetical protein
MTNYKFFKSVLIPMDEEELIAITKGVSIAERLSNDNGINPNAECPDCKQNKWMLYPKEINDTLGGKPYIECLTCGYITHL